MNNYITVRNTTCDRCGMQSGWVMHATGERAPASWHVRAGNKHYCPDCVAEHPGIKREKKWTIERLMKIVIERQLVERTFVDISKEFGVGPGFVGYKYRHALRRLCHPNGLAKAELIAQARKRGLTGVVHASPPWEVEAIIQIEITP